MTSADPHPRTASEMERLACLARLISPVVHRMNNSLAVLRGACDLTLQQSYSAHLQRASIESGRIADTLAQLSACAKTHAPRQDPFDLAAALTRARLLIDALTSTHAVEFHNRLGEGQGAPVCGDRARLEQILVWFAAEGLRGAVPGPLPAPIRLRISLTRTATRIVLTGLRVRGEGVEATTPSVCLEAARELGSHPGVAVRAGVRAGTVTFLRFSYSPLEAPSEGSAPPAPAKRPRPRVLLVEKDTPRRELVRTVLEESGYRVRVPARDEPMPEELPLEEVELVLLDADQAEERGEFLEELIRGTETRGSARMALLGTSPRADAFPDLPQLREPFRPGELIELLESLLR